MRCCKPSRHDATTCDRDLSANGRSGRYNSAARRGACAQKSGGGATAALRARAHRLSALRTYDDECAAGGGAPAALRGACASTFGPSPLRQRVHIATLCTTIDSRVDRRPSSERFALPMALCGVREGARLCDGDARLASRWVRARSAAPCNGSGASRLRPGTGTRPRGLAKRSAFRPPRVLSDAGV